MCIIFGMYHSFSETWSSTTLWEFGMISQKREGRQDDCPGRHWRRWRQALTSPVTARTVILTAFPFLWYYIWGRGCAAWLQPFYISTLERAPAPWCHIIFCCCMCICWHKGFRNVKWFICCSVYFCFVQCHTIENKKQHHYVPIGAYETIIGCPFQMREHEWYVDIDGCKCAI